LRPIREPFEDDGERGHNEDRPGLQAILEYVRTHPNPAKFNEDFIPILVYNVSRFGRFDDEKKIFYYLVDIERYGYEFYSVQDGLRSRGNIADFIQLIIRSQQAYQYTLDLSAYGIRTGCSLSEKGWWPGGSSPFGMDRITYGMDGKPRYRYFTLHDKTVEKRTLDGALIESFPPINDKGKLRSAYSDKLKSDKVKLAPNLERAKIVEMIFQWFVVEGWGLKRIAARLNQQGVAPPRGRNWLKGSVRDILRNPAYKGAIAYGRCSDGKHHDVRFEKLPQGYVAQMRRRDVAKREYVRRPLEDCVVVENCHEAIVTPEVWEAAREKFALRKRGQLGIRGKGARGSNYLLTGDGLMKCVHCGYHFHGSTDRKSKIRYYLDGGYHMGGREVCSMTLVRAEDLERIILEAIQAAAVNGDAKLFENEAELALAIERELAAQNPATERPDPEREALQEKLSAIRRKREEAERFEKEFGAAASDLVRRIQAEEQGLLRELAARRPAAAEPMDARERARLSREMARHQMFVHAAL
ncbi:MAG: recombinase family protein, partial [Vicinamibacteria bacterium]